MQQCDFGTGGVNLGTQIAASTLRRRCVHRLPPSQHRVGVQLTHQATLLHNQNETTARINPAQLFAPLLAQSLTQFAHSCGKPTLVQSHNHPMFAFNLLASGARSQLRFCTRRVLDKSAQCLEIKLPSQLRGWHVDFLALCKRSTPRVRSQVHETSQTTTGGVV